MTWMLVDLIRVDREIQSSSYESPDSRGTRNDHESVSGFQWRIREVLSAGDHKVSYWANQKILGEIKEAQGRLYQSAGNPFLKMVFKEDVFIPLENALEWGPSDQDFNWLGAPTKDHWDILVGAGFKPEYIVGSNRYQKYLGGGSEGSDQHKISVVLHWATGGAFGRGDSANVYNPTLHGILSKDLQGDGSPHVSDKKGETDIKRVSLTVHKL